MSSRDFFFIAIIGERFLILTDFWTDISLVSIQSYMRIVDTPQFTLRILLKNIFYPRALLSISYENDIQHSIILVE